MLRSIFSAKADAEVPQLGKTLLFLITTDKSLFFLKSRVENIR